MAHDPQGPLTLKGFDDPVNAFELQGSADRPDGGQAGPRCGD
ncbi:adenylate cyclase domain protein [Mycobacterium ulcerans str. Harvey]|uniref:Adenylate cyclase domain protein n=1 Tax=Mycobacterium ulcerans str. Harvey TaxID=1299332 RepID=A0ABN0QSX1_MYCUL|nr:adenylate cyclase domain protein [Mycobacterium ulcerans str. Harvey]